jgi:molecular chaperone GrpE
MPKEDPEKIDLNLDEQTVDEGPEDVAAAAAEAMKKAAKAGRRDISSGAADAEPSAITAQLAKLQAEKDELRTAMVRRQADFENYKKRVDRERAEDRSRATAVMVENLLPVLDAFERALAAHADPAYEEYRKGFELIYRQVLDVLVRYGLEPIEAVGRPFDPHLHHAVERVESPDHEDGIVIEEHQKGYLFRERVLRPSMVRVSYRPEEPALPPPDSPVN